MIFFYVRHGDPIYNPDSLSPLGERLAEAVRERQQYAWLCSQLYRKAGLGSVSLDLCNGDTGEPRYTLHVVDSPTVKPSRDNHFAMFISELGLLPLFPEGGWLTGAGSGDLVDGYALAGLILQGGCTLRG